MAPINIDGSPVQDITIDGETVTEVTVDGDVVFPSFLDNYIEDNFNDNDLTRPRSGQEDGEFQTQDGTVVSDARIRPDWNIVSFTSASGGELVMGPGNNLNSDRGLCNVDISIQPPFTVEYDVEYEFTTDANEFHVGIKQGTDPRARNGNGYYVNFRPESNGSNILGRVENDASNSLDRLENTPPNGTYTLQFNTDSFGYTRPDGVSRSVSANLTEFTYQRLVFSMFDDNFADNTHFVDNFRIF